MKFSPPLTACPAFIKHRSSVLSAAAAILFCPPLAAAEPSAAGDPVQAVHDAHAVELPDWHQTLKNSSSIVGSVGGGSLSLVESEKSHWQNGQGNLYAPALTRTVGCRQASDPECLAVQVLDRGFPEHPAVPDSLLSGRDEIVGSTESGGSGSGSQSCRDFMIEVPGVTSESVCSVGGPFADRSCRTGWAETVSGTASLWACLIESSRTAHFACSISSSPSAILESHWRCLFNSEALAEQYQSYLVTSAKATAVFPAVCRAPQKTVVLHKCSKTLSVTTDGSCLIGSETTVTARGDAQLGTDSCTGGDTLTITHQCAAGESNDSSRVLYVSLNGFGNAKIRGLKSVSMSAGACSAAVQVLEHSCTGTDKTACTARVRARIYAGSLHSGDIAGTIAYQGWKRGAALTDTWTDGCAGLTGEPQ